MRTYKTLDIYDQAEYEALIQLLKDHEMEIATGSNLDYLHLGNFFIQVCGYEAEQGL